MSSMRVWTGGGLVVVLTDEGSPARAIRHDLTFFPSVAQDRWLADRLDLLRHDVVFRRHHLAADAFFHHVLDALGDARNAAHQRVQVLRVEHMATRVRPKAA
jgi:hypothetical protein